MTPDQEALFDLCALIGANPKCSGCSYRDCQKALAKVMTATMNAQLGLFTNAWETGSFPCTNYCERWCVEFREELSAIDKSDLLWAAACLNVQEVRYDLSKCYGWYTAHVAERITFCDGTVAYVDIGTWGSTDRVFFQSAIPACAR
jgi:hypothetical protein